jgi:tRNA uridine 5-carboxymethylaminomethyl modification enzyme
MTHSLPGFENCKIVKYAYAIEYDAIDPLQMKPSLESKIIENLFTAGQINGTSGYEEAAGQGLIAGINAVMKLDGREPLVLARDEAYIGVLIDDLTTKGTKEPYRLLTSRAEFRLLLRHDNADQRLMKKGYEIGLVSEERYRKFEEKMENIRKLKEYLEETHADPANEKTTAYLKETGYDLGHRVKMIELIKRPKIELEPLLESADVSYDPEIVKQCEIEIKYAGYIEKAKREARKLLAMDQKKIPQDLDYEKIENLSLEGRQKLTQIRPETIGQASRISGVNPADITVLLIAMKQRIEEHI